MSLQERSIPCFSFILYQVSSAYNIALILFLLGSIFVFVFVFCFFLLTTRTQQPLHIDASIVYRGRGGARRTRPIPVTSCLDPSVHGRRHGNGMERSAEKVHLYTNVVCGRFSPSVLVGGVPRNVLFFVLLCFFFTLGRFF